MDELQLLSELLPPPAPPSPEVVAAARARLAAEPSRARPLPRRRPRRLVLAAGAAATAAVVAAVTLTAGGTPAPAAQLSVFQLPAGAAATGTGGPGRPILLTAARAVARGAPPASGRYWVSPAVAGNFIPVGHGDDHYLILEKSINDQYMATKFRAWSPQVVQQLGVQLASPG